LGTELQNNGTGLIIEISVDVLRPPRQIVPMRQARLKAPSGHPVACCMTASLPGARPGTDRFRCGGRESNFLAVSLTIVAAVVMATAAVAQEMVKLPDKVAQQAKCLNPEFLLYRPKGVDADQKAPLLIYLHGRAERGRDIKVIQRVSGWGLTANARKHNFLLVMPQCDTDARGEGKGAGRWKAEDVKLLLEHVKGEHKIDENRIYLAGYSMGGFGTWAAAIA